MTDTPARSRDAVWCRRVAKIVGTGAALAVCAAAILGALGGRGQASALVLLGTLGLTFVISGLVAMVSAVVDEHRQQQVSWRRPLLGLVLAVMGLCCAAMAGALVVS